MDDICVVVNTSDLHPRDPRSFRQRVEYNLLFNVHIVNLLLKSNGARDRRPNFVIFAVWKAVIVGGLVVMAWALSLI